MGKVDQSTRAIVFDGFCNVCSGWAGFMMRHPARPPFALIPMQSDEGRALLEQHGIDPEVPTTFLVLDQERAFTESTAAIHLVSQMSGLWKGVVVLRILPRSWRDAAYRLLARNRYRWFGRRSTCFLSR
jgi:predicted DCC family thiol-disulfide oxidoreductase YuxK